MTRDNPGIPRFIHRREVVFIGQENGGIQNARFIAALFFQHGVNLCQRVGGLLKGIGVEVFRYTSVVERVVVDYYIRPAGFSIDTNDSHHFVLIILPFSCCKDCHNVRLPSPLQLAKAPSS
ncbi:Uncharacterised protein [Shigella sonnei]|nr:hypothetical protein P12B_c1272 [Escherichia coli P12b]KFZ96820.1 hypothetical protein DP20_3578 [Shigella flexneri]CSF53816.1 Uncharacterised protein [Shigella sonnei]CSQ06243.1 Uncharacterised protein [Shigella sonnei]